MFFYYMLTFIVFSTNFVFFCVHLIFVKSHNNIDDILFDLSSQIESFNEYIYNVQYIRDNKFLIKNKLKSQFDIDYISYKDLLNSSNISPNNEPYC